MGMPDFAFSLYQFAVNRLGKQVTNLFVICCFVYHYMLEFLCSFLCWSDMITIKSSTCIFSSDTASVLSFI